MFVVRNSSGREKGRVATLREAVSYACGEMFDEIMADDEVAGDEFGFSFAFRREGKVHTIVMVDGDCECTITEEE